MGNTFSWQNASVPVTLPGAGDWAEEISPIDILQNVGPPGAGDTAVIDTLSGTISGDLTVASLTVSGILTGLTVTGHLDATDSLNLGDATIDGGAVTSDNGSALFGTLDLVNGGMVVVPKGINFQNPVTVTDGTIEGGDIAFFNAATLEAGAITGTDVSFGGTNKSFQITGGTVSAENGFTGLIGTDSNTVSLSGAAVWNSATSLTVGDFGSGEIDVSGGATLSAGGSGTPGREGLVIGSTGGGHGSIDVAASTLSVSGDLVFGFYVPGSFSGSAGTGVLSVDAGASASVTGTTDLGDLAGGKGSVTVNGSNAELSSDLLVVGNAGTGSLTVSAGASASASSDIQIGATAGGSGMVSVGTGAELSAGGSLVVGDAGSGSLDVNAGSLSVFNQTLTAGNQAQSNGDISFENSIFTSNTGTLVIGNAGSGSLSVNTKSVINAAELDIGTSITGNGTVVFSGTSGFFTGDVDAGIAGNSGLEVTRKGTLSANNLLMATGGVPQPSGVTVDGGGVVQMGGQAVVGQAGNATMEIQSGGTGIVTLAAAGVLAVGGATTVWSGGSLVMAGGSLSGTAEAMLVLGTVEGYGSISGSITNSGGVTASGGVLALGSLVTGTGTLALSGGTLDLNKGAAATQAIAFAAGTDKLQLDALGATLGTIEGFGFGDTIQVTGTLADTGTWAGGMLTLTETASTVGSLAVAGGFAADSFKVTNNGTNTTIVLACFTTGTGIATTTGRKQVEALRVGDQVPTLSGRIAAIRWIGRRETDLARHARPWDVMPVRVRAGAFGPAVPGRDLVLSPDHAVLVDGALIPVRHLANGVSIVQEARARVTYWHVELDRHDAILAEGLACESCLDTGNRCAFEGEPALQLHADFAQARAMAVWDGAGCAPILADPSGARLRAAHTELLRKTRQRPQNKEPNSELLR